MKRAILLACAVVFVAALAVLPGAGAASAAVPANCLGKTLHSANHVRTNGGNDLGAIQLCRDGDYWFALYISDRIMPQSHRGNGRIDHFIDGNYNASWSCDAPGGNGKVVTGEQWCVTPKLYSYSSRISFEAVGYEDYRADGYWITYAIGKTLRCNRFVGCV